MDLHELKRQLEDSVAIYEKKNAYREKIIVEEIKELEKLLTFLSPILPLKIINGKKAVLIYVFAESKKKTVSPDVYFCEDGKIRYQVYLKDEYLSYNPTVEFEGAYAVVEAIEMFSKRNGLEFADIVEFYVERIESLREIAESLKESGDVRKQYLENFKKITKRY